MKLTVSQLETALEAAKCSNVVLSNEVSELQEALRECKADGAIQLLQLQQQLESAEVRASDADAELETVKITSASSIDELREQLQQEQVRIFRACRCWIAALTMVV